MAHHPGDEIGVFLAVCESGSFSAAAERLRLSPSAAAKAVGRLENRLRIRLFQRTTRRLNLTLEGIVYRDVCRQARTDISRAEAEIAHLRQEPSGRLVVSLPPLFGAKIIAPALYELCRRWPALSLEISSSTEPVDLPGAGIDLAVRIGDLPDVNALVARPLGTQHIVLCAATEYIRRRSMPNSVEELGGHDLIATSQKGRARAWHFQQRDGSKTIWHPKARLLLDGGVLTLGAIREGQGIGLVPRWLVAHDLAHGRLLPILDDQVSGHLPINAIWPASPILLPRLRVAIDAIVEATAPLRTG